MDGPSFDNEEIKVGQVLEIQTEGPCKHPIRIKDRDSPSKISDTWRSSPEERRSAIPLSVALKGLMIGCKYYDTIGDALETFYLKNPEDSFETS